MAADSCKARGANEIEERLMSSGTRERAGGSAKSTATSTLAVDGLPEDHELHNGGFSSEDRRRAPEEVRKVERDKWRHRGARGIQRGFIWMR
jgi:hypothetical protein